MSRLTAKALALTVLPLATLVGCVVEVGPDPAPVQNFIPYVDFADSGCYWDNPNRDHVWYFEADVSDGNGAYDVVEVWADVYDGQGFYLESFRLFRETPSPSYWFSDWLQTYSLLDCGWSDYTIDIVAYDALGEFDLTTIRPYQTP